MGTLPVSEADYIAKSLIYAQGYTRALADSESAFSPSQRREVGELIKLIVKIADALGPQIRLIVQRRQEAEDQEVLAFLKQTSEIVEANKRLAAIRSQVVRKDPSLIEVWSDADQQRIECVCELFEEAEETLALGLSSVFRKDIEAARTEAGITNGESSVPAR